MCFHNSAAQRARDLAKRFRADVDPAADDLGPIYHANGFLFPRWPVVGPDAVLRGPRWGLVPAWARGAEQAAAIRAKTLNARCETLFEKPSFREAARSGRCLVVSTGFFEWHETGGRRYPFFIRLREGDVFALAGVAATWQDPAGGQPQATFSVVTCPASPLLARIHNTRQRMPVILPEASRAAWLDPGLDPEQARRLCVPFDDARLEAWPVGPLLGRRGAETNVPGVSRPHDWGLPLPGPDQAGPRQLDLFPPGDSAEPE